MKIAYFSASIIPSESANSIQVMKMCEYFTKSGQEVTLFCRKSVANKDPFEFYNISNRFQIVYTNWPNLKFLGGFLYGFRIKKKVPKDIDFYFGRDFYSLYFLRKKKVKMIFEVHTLPRNKIRLFLEGKIFQTKFFLGVVAISNSLKRDYQKKYGIKLEKKIAVLHDAAESKKNQKVKISIPIKNVGYVGSLNTGKGLNVIVELAIVFPN
jgi:hypothetical protein